MPPAYDLILRGGICLLPGGAAQTDIAVRAGRIAGFGTFGGESGGGESGGGEVIDCRGLHVLPGVIDSQVHFREPGLEHKEDLATGTAGAALGGVTAVFEMPNTQPPTVSAAALADKCRRAKDRVWVDIAFYIGAAAENTAELASLERLPACAGVKMFMGSSTGSLLVADDATIAKVLANGSRRVAVHAEDEQRLQERFTIVRGGAEPALHPEWRDAETAARATSRLLALAEGVRRRVHVLHISTAEEMEILRDHRDIATVEVTPQHLTLSAPGCYQEHDTYAQMNPPIRDARHREALWRGLQDGLVDCIGSDHAPHTRDEKNRPYPNSPSGMPGVQTLVPLMLDHVARGRLSLERMVDLTSSGPARIFGVAGRGRIALGYRADFTIVDLKAKRMITNRSIASRCGWTPFDGVAVTGWPMLTVVGGRVVMRDGALQGEPAGQSVKFLECL